MMERWKIGFIKIRRFFYIIPFFHYSIIPKLSLDYAALSSPSLVGKTSPLKIQTFTPIIP